MTERTAPGPVVCFGEILLRLSVPRGERLFDERSVLAHFGGAEANVAVALAQLERPVRMVSAVPDDAIGSAALAPLRSHGVDVAFVTRRTGRLGLYYLEPGAGPRAASVVYDRAGSSFAQWGPDDVDWEAALEGASWLHLSGINPALGPRASEISLAGIAAARRLGVRVSFDGNHRAQLWASWASNPKAIISEILTGVDLFIGNHRDIALILDRHFDGKDDAMRRAAALAAFDAFPNLAWIASTVRIVEDADRQSLGARLDSRERGLQIACHPLANIVDRIGSGDAFAAGVLDGLLADDEERALETGHALAVLKHFCAGDQSRAAFQEVQAFLAGERDVRR